MLSHDTQDHREGRRSQVLQPEAERPLPFLMLCRIVHVFHPLQSSPFDWNYVLDPTVSDTPTEWCVLHQAASEMYSACLIWIPMKTVKVQSGTLTVSGAVGPLLAQLLQGLHVFVEKGSLVFVSVLVIVPLG
jgi:hypothetical protein